MVQPWNLGPPAVDFSALGKLGDSFTNAFDGARKKTALANIGQDLQSGNYDAAAQKAFATGDVNTGLGIMKLGQGAKDRAADSDLLKGIFGGGTSPSSSGVVAAPSAPSAPDARSSLIQNESGGRWNAQNDARGAGGMTGHFGRLQFGQARLQEAAAAGAIPAGTTPQQFMASPELQKSAENWHFNDIDKFIAGNGLDKMVGKTINGVPVTVDGMRAVAHLGGKGGLAKFVMSGGKYNPADANGTRLSDYFARHGGGGETVPAPTAVASAPLPPIGAGPQVAAAPQQAIPGDDPATLRADAQAYAQTNPEAARQMLARAEALEAGPRQPVQVAQAQAQPGTPVADVPAAGAAPAQGFAIPGTDVVVDQQTLSSNPRILQLSRALASARGETAKTAIKQRLDLELLDAKQKQEIAKRNEERRYQEGKGPEAVREWKWAKDNGLTEAKSPVAYAKEKADATRADSAPTVRQLKQADGSEVAVQWNPETKTWDPLAAPKGGEAVRPTGMKLTEGQSKDLIYHSRGLQALEAFEPLAAAYANGAERLASQVPGGNYVVSEEFQKAKQAGRNFLASVLRKDTGAAVTPSEETLYGDIFLPQPGDKPGTLAQKAEARAQAIDAIRGGMGTAEVLALGKKLTTRQPGQDAPAKKDDGWQDIGGGIRIREKR